MHGPLARRSWPWPGPPLAAAGILRTNAPPPGAQALAVVHRAEDDRVTGRREHDHGGLMPYRSSCGRPLPGQAPPPVPGARAPFPGWAVALFVIIAVCVPAAVSAGCASGGDGAAVMEPASPRGAPRTPFPAATTSMSEGRSGLRIVSVVPPPYARGPWTGADVIVAYLPSGAPLVLSRCKLTVNGRRQRARLGSSMLSPVQPILIFSWTTPYPPGSYRFRVTVVARGGKTATAEWTYAYR